MILAILQARFSSSRLPGKVLLPLLGKPMLLRQIERIKRSKSIEILVIATSTDKLDDNLEILCKENNINCYRGNLNDVLDRFYQAAKKYSPEHVVRLTGDCPLADPDLIDEIIHYHLKGNYDYTTNAVEATYPDGLDVEVFKFECLEKAWKNAKLPSEREHVTPYINKQPEIFQLAHYKNSLDLSNLRWTVDEQLDYELVTKIYNELYPSNPEFTTQDILKLLEKKPELKTFNTRFDRNEGLQKSLQEDLEFMKQ